MTNERVTSKILLPGQKLKENKVKTIDMHPNYLPM